MRRDHGVQWLAPTSGLVSGWAGVGTGVIAAVVAAITGSVTVVLLGLWAAMACWMVLLRPRIGVGTDNLLLRGILSTMLVPLSAITTVRVRQVFVVWVGDKRYMNPSVGRTLREVRPRPASQGERANPHVEHIIELVQSHAADARRRGSGEQNVVRRRWDWPEIGTFLALTAALSVAALVG